jgi:hypothetical protein
MLTLNPFTAVTDYLSPLAIKACPVPMVLTAVIGKFCFISRKGSAKFFALRRDRLLASHAHKALWLRTRIVRGRVPSLRISGVVSPNQRNL